jgi:hypothetical protein
MMYQQACALLARLCPEWWSRAHLTEWTQVGSIEALFRGQYCRMLNSAWAKDGRAEVERVDGNATMAERGEAYMDDADGE